MLTRWLIRARVRRLKRYEARFLRDAKRDTGIARQVGLLAALDMRERRLRVEAHQRAMNKAKGL